MCLFESSLYLGGIMIWFPIDLMHAGILFLTTILNECYCVLLAIAMQRISCLQNLLCIFLFPN